MCAEHILTVAVDFYFALTHLLYVIIEIQGYLVEHPASSSPVPAGRLQRPREGLRKDVYTLRSVYTVSFQKDPCSLGLTGEGRLIAVWPVTRLLF